jgi:hypothetical protein
MSNAKELSPEYLQSSEMSKMNATGWQAICFWESNGLSKDFEGLKTEIYVSGQEMIAFFIA